MRAGRVTRGRRLSRSRAVLAGALLAVGILAAALGVAEWRLRARDRVATRRGEPAEWRLRARDRGATRRGEPAAPRRVALMLVDEETCYSGFAPNTRLDAEHPRAPLRFRYASDGEGFRDAPHGGPARAACRVLALGDSFTVGLWVEAAEAWPAVLEARLRARGFAVRVDNGGVQGHTIAEARIEALSRWASLRPRVIVVGRTNNDLADLTALQASGCRVGGALPAELSPALPDALTDVRLVSGAMEVRARLRVMTARLNAMQRGSVAAAPDAARCAAAQDAYIAEAADLARGAARIGARVAFAELEVTSCGDGFTRSDGERFERRLADAVSPLGARLFDLKAALSVAGATFAPHDNHPSARGHAAIAERLAEQLAASGWLDGCR